MPPQESTEPSHRVVMQGRCVRCKREHYAIAVSRISHGLAACWHCDHVPPVFTSRLAYREQLLGAAPVI